MAKHRKEAWLLDDGILLPGYKDKYGFHPYREIQCGFDCQKLRKKDKNVIYFMSLDKALSTSNHIDRIVFSKGPIPHRNPSLLLLAWQK